MKRILVALVGLAGLAAAGCDNKAPTAAETTPPPAPVAAPVETKPAPPATQTVDLATANVTSKAASLTDDAAAGGKLLKTDPAYGGYSVTIALPVVPAGMKVVLELDVKKGSIGAAVTEANDANKWDSAEVVADAGKSSKIEIDAKSLDPAKSLLIRNAGKGGPSEAVLKSLTVIAP